MSERIRAVYVISVVAELADVHPQTLRMWERKGLISPRRTAGNVRRYSDADVSTVGEIKRLLAQGLNLEGVQRVLELQAEVAELRRQLAEAHTALAEAEAETERRVREAEQRARPGMLVKLAGLPVPYRPPS